MITWLVNPVRYAYLRKTPYMSLYSRFPAKTIGRRLADFAVLVGYEKVVSRRYHYEYTFYWLKRHDRDIQPEGVYRGPHWYGGFMPCEAVDVIELLRSSPYRQAVTA